MLSINHRTKISHQNEPIFQLLIPFSFVRLCNSDRIVHEYSISYVASLNEAANRNNKPHVRQAR